MNSQDFRITSEKYYYSDIINIIGNAYVKGLQYLSITSENKNMCDRLNDQKIQELVHYFLFSDRATRMPLYLKGWCSKLYYGNDQMYKYEYIINAITNEMNIPYNTGLQSYDKFLQFYYVCNYYYRCNKGKVNEQDDPVFIYFNKLNEALNSLSLDRVGNSTVTSTFCSQKGEPVLTAENNNYKHNKIIVYRYLKTSIPEVIFGKIMDMSFASTSVTPTNDFTKGHFFSLKTQLKITIPMTKCRSLHNQGRNLTYYPEEYEVMLLGGTMCKVISVDQPDGPNGMTYIELEYDEEESMMCDFQNIDNSDNSESKFIPLVKYVEEITGSMIIEDYKIKN
jgi:hypothetical protein